MAFIRLFGALKDKGLDAIEPTKDIYYTMMTKKLMYVFNDKAVAEANKNKVASIKKTEYSEFKGAEADKKFADIQAKATLI